MHSEPKPMQSRITFDTQLKIALNNESADDSKNYGLHQLSAGRNVIKVTSPSVRNIDILYTTVNLNPIHCTSLCLGNLIPI